MKMGEMPSFKSEGGSDTKDFKKFETPKTRAQQEAENNARQMEGGASSDNPSGSASSSASYQDFLEQLMGSSQSGSAGGSHAQRDEDSEFDLPGAVFDARDARSGNPQEEIKKLKQEIANKAKALQAEPERVANKTLQEYSNLPAETVLRPAAVLPAENLMQEVLKLKQEEHDKQIEELLRLVPHRGVKNVMSIVKKMNNAHLSDDFHRALVQYFANSLPAPNTPPDLEKDLKIALYEVQLGVENPVEQEQGIRQEKVQSLERLLLTMEQFYAGMLSVTGKAHSFSIEIAKPLGREDLSFYVSVPYDRKELFERHLSSIYPDAKLNLLRDDFNVFSYAGRHVVSVASLSKNYAAPLKSYKEFTHDPLNIILGAFSGLKSDEGAAIQFVIGDDGNKYNDFVQKVVTNLRKNKSFNKAVLYAESAFAPVKDEIKKHFKEMILGEDKSKPDPIDEVLLEQVIAKSKSRIVPVNLRLVSSSFDDMRASSIMAALESSFNQFENARLNSIKFTKKSGKLLEDAIEKFIYRRYDENESIKLSRSELSTMLHLTAAGVRTSRELKKSRFKQAAAPIELSDALRDMKEGKEKAIILGKNKFGANESMVPFLETDRMRHFYEIGQTGTGKSYLMKSMIIQDIKNGEGVCYIDPHGTDILDVLAAVPPERADDLIYFDPAYTARPYGLNILEWDEQYPEQKTFVTNELYEIFVKLFGDVPESLGPMFQQYYRNATLLALEGQPAGKATMADIPKVFADREFRRKLLENSKNPIVNQFWIEIAEKAGGDASLENVTPYITAKTDTFLANEIMRPIIVQEKSTINFRQIMDERKILLVNLSKGRIGELNAQLLGLIVVGKFLQAALSRVDVLSGKELAPFYLYIDEFQNFTTPSIATILSEARKYKLSLNLAHQFIKQLDEKIRDAVFGNVGSKCVFRVSTEDAEFLEKSFAPEFTAKDISSIENYNAYLSLLVKGTPAKPFNIETITYDWNLDFEYADKLRQLSYLKYGKERQEIEEEIAKKYMPDMSNQEAAPPPFPWM